MSMKTKLDQLFAIAAGSEKRAYSETLERGLILKAVWFEGQPRKLVAARRNTEPSHVEIEVLVKALGWPHHVLGTPGVTPSGLRYIEIMEVLPMLETTSETAPVIEPAASEVPQKEPELPVRTPPAPLDRDAMIQAIMTAKVKVDPFWDNETSRDLLGKGLRDMKDHELAVSYRRNVLQDYTHPDVLAEKVWDRLPTLEESLAQKEGRLL
jgi:hypothetical protein